MTNSVSDFDKNKAHKTVREDTPDPMVLRFPGRKIRNTLAPCQWHPKPAARRDQETRWDSPYVPNVDPSRLPKGPERDFLVLLAESGLTIRDVAKLWNTLYDKALGCTAATFRRIHPEFTQDQALWKQIGGEIGVWFLRVMEWIVQQQSLQRFEQAGVVLDVPRQGVG